MTDHNFTGLTIGLEILEKLLSIEQLVVNSLNTDTIRYELKNKVGTHK